MIPAAGWLILAGIILFSGSLYVLSVKKNPLARPGHSAWRSFVHHRLGAACDEFHV